MGRLGREEQGSVAVEAAFVLPVLLAAAMMVFEAARYALVLVIGHLALEAALDGLRQQGDRAFGQAGDAAAIIKAGMLSAAYGYLRDDEIAVQATWYTNLAAFGGTQDEAAAAAPGRRPSTLDVPVLDVEADVTLDWITALPRLLGLGGGLSYRCHQVLGDLSPPERRRS